MCVVARLKESVSWNLSWVGPYLEQPVENIALNAKNPGQEGSTRMVAASYGRSVQLWQICDNGQKTREVGKSLTKLLDILDYDIL